MKIWCEICKIQVVADNRGMAIHEKSQIHRKNRQRELDYQQKKAQQQKQDQQKKQKEEEEAYAQIQQLEERALIAHNAYLNKQKQEAQQKEFLERQINLLKEKQLEQQQVQLPTQFPQYNLEEFQQIQLNLQQENNFQKIKSSGEIQNIWKLVKDENSNRLYFFNHLTNEKKYDKPFGLKLNEQEQQLWNNQQEKLEQEQVKSKSKLNSDTLESQSDDLDKKQEKKSLDNQKFNNESEQEVRSSQENQLESLEKGEEEKQNDPAQENNPTQKDKSDQGEWQNVVEPSENFFEKYKVKIESSDSSSNSDIDNKQASLKKNKNNFGLEKLYQQIEDGKQIDDKKIIETILLDSIEGQTNESVLKQKNDQLKKIVAQNIELPSQLRKPVNLKSFQKQDLLNWHNQSDPKQDLKEEDAGQQKFKKRKIASNKQFKEQNDMDDF